MLSNAGELAIFRGRDGRKASLGFFMVSTHIPAQGLYGRHRGRLVLGGASWLYRSNKANMRFLLLPRRRYLRS